MAGVELESSAATMPTVRQNIMPKSASSATTTTMSTIAVRAEPHSTIVVAIVRSVGFVELRIDEMEPGLLQIGTNPSENGQLLLLHEDLYARLLGKEEQVEELLGRAEKLVTEQTEPDDILIYEAMADGLATAWKSLSRQLSIRGYILTDTQHLYEIALKHEELAKLANSRLCKNGAIQSPDELQRIIDELAELTHEGLEIGSTVIAQIRILGALADNEERPREVLNACLAIEKIMLRIAQSWELIENSWRLQRDGGQVATIEEQMRNIATSARQPHRAIENAKKEKPAPPKAVGNFSANNLVAAEQWLLTAAQRFDRVRDCEEDEELELAILITDIKSNYASLKALSEQIDPVLHATSATRCEQLLERYNRLLKEVQMRNDLLERTQTMMHKTDTLLVQLDKMRDDLRHASAAMAGELGPLAQQKGVALIEDGVQLSAHWEREPAGGHKWGPAVDARVERLKEAVIDVVRMARDRIASGKADKLREMLASLESWLHSVAGHMLSKPITLNPTAAETNEFLMHLRRFSNEITYKEQQLRSLVSSQQKSQHFVPAEEQRLDALHAGISRIRQIVEQRLQIGQTMEQLQKLSRELNTSLHFLSTLLKSESANIESEEQCQKQFEQMRNLLQQANEHIYRERHQTDKLISLANSANGTDACLDIVPALDWSRSMLSIHENELKRLTKLSSQWEKEYKNRQNFKLPADGTFPPRFTVPLASEHRAVLGTRVELSARIEANPDVQICWLKDGNSIGELIGHRRMNWLNGLATLVIEELLEDDIGEYTLIGRNALGEADSRCTVNVLQSLGGTAKFSNNEKQMLVGEVKTTHNDGQQAPTVVCTTTTVTQFETDESPNQNEQQQQQHVQPVHAPPAVEQQPCKPRFVRQLVNVSGREGCPFVLDCVVVGNPEPKIIWYREEETVRESDRIRLAFHGDHCTLSCSDARTEDAGLYKALAVNRHGETMNFCRVCIVPPSPPRRSNSKNGPPPPTAPKPVTPIIACRVDLEEQQQVEEQQQITEIVTVQNFTVFPDKDIPPRIEPPLSSQVVREGQSVNFQVLVKGFPPPEVRWFFNSTPISHQQQQEFIISKGPTENCQLLNIPNVSLAHSGQYSVEAQNKVGQAHSSATLNVLVGLDETTSKTTFTTTATTSPTSGFDSPQLFQQQHSSPVYQNNNFGDFCISKTMAANNNTDHHQQRRHTDQRSWGSQSVASSPRGIVYTLSKSDRAESARSSDFEDPGLGYSSLANPPEFIRAFQTEVTINEGESAEVDCLMVGNPRPKIRWFFNDRPVKSSPGFFEFSNVGDTYTIRFAPARLECAGYYRLCAENSRGWVEAQTLVHIRPKSMIPKPLRQRRSLGDARVGAGAGGIQALLRSQHERYWAQRKRALSTPPQQQQQQQLFMRTDEQQIAGKVATATNSLKQQAQAQQQQQQQQQQFYAIYNQQQQNGGHKWPQITAPASPIKATATTTTALATRTQLLMNGTKQHNEKQQQFDKRAHAKQLLMNDQQIRHRTPPQPKGSAPHFIQTLVSVVAPEGQNAKFEAIVTGTPQPRIEWSKNGEPLAQSDNVYFWSEAGRDYLVVEKAGPADVGKYCCTAENALGMASSSAQLLLRPKTIAPDFVQRLVSEEVEEGMPLKWTVQISGDPPPTVKWLLDGHQIEHGQDGVQFIQQDFFAHILLIDAVKLSNGGQYTCVLENSAGEARSTADLVVRLKGTAPGKYVHVTKVTQERHQRGEEIAQRETVVVDEIVDDENEANDDE
ncbi:hypothetical protein niasHT_038878 [Heterodera trifolii]|uniref:Ig-like domain-containing protein n=1 Tax=Heterodera trifolii TaxID=157864 RepID=A0ABD2ISJ0_9BILA